MRRSRGMTFVEVLTAMLVTMIIGGTAVMFLRSGLDLEMANTISASNQQSLRTPLLELSPLVERASDLEILKTLPDADTLKLSEIVVYIADPADSKKLSSSQNNMYLRTRSGDSLVPGFSHITAARFDRVSLLPSGSLIDSKDHQAVRFSLTAENSGRELVYSTDIRSLNKIPVQGPDSGPMLKINLHGVILYPFIKYAEIDSGKVSADDIPSGVATLPVETTVAGCFHVLSGSPDSEFEYEWRLYSKLASIDSMLEQDYSVVGKSGIYNTADLKKHYEDRFTSVDLSVTPPTGTTTHTQPPYVLELQPNMQNKYITFAVREKGKEEWVQSRWYLIALGQSGSFWRDLIDELKADVKNRTHETIIPNMPAEMDFGALDDTTGEPYLLLKGNGDAGRGFLAKLLDEKYFKRLEDKTRDPEFCLENYTMWIDSIVEAGASGTGGALPSKGWGVFLNGNLVRRPKDHSHYAYMLQFDPGMEYLGIPNVEFFYNKTIKKNILNTQGLVMRKIEGDDHNGGAAYGLGRMVRWKEKNDASRWDTSREPYRRYYHWGDLAYKGSGFIFDERERRSYKDAFAINEESNEIYSMRNKRYVTEITLITQTKKQGLGETLKTVPESVFCRVRVYDKPRTYDKTKKKWVFPPDTGRSKEMWLGVEFNGQDYRKLIWGLPYNQPFSSPIENGFERGDSIYEPALLKNEKVHNYKNSNFFGDLIGKHFGLRVWADAAFDAKIYFIDIAKGFPLDYKLPWGTRVDEIMKPVGEGGNWNPKEPYELKNFR